MSSIIDFLIQRNREQSAIYSSSDVTLARRQYREIHPTEIAALKCMDGRLNLPFITHTPVGIIQPFRNIGGQFDLGWPFFGELVNDWVRYAISRGRNCVILVTYHWSAGEKHRGCKGFAYDTHAARVYTEKLRGQVETVFGTAHTVVYPIQVGIETDSDALVLHGVNAQVLDLATVDKTLTDEALRVQLQQLYPDMQWQMLNDLLPLLRGNLEHIAQIRAANRPIAEAEHKEQILAIGRGFDWLHLPNKALIIGPFSYNLGQPLATAAKILLDNLQAGRIPKAEGVALLTSGAYRDEAGPEKHLAVEKAKSLSLFAQETIRAEVPELMPNLHVLAGILNMNTRLFTPLSDQTKK
ncbi:MAG: hypothetical protein AAB424_01780 [Patescibacteria group bacterium]